MCRAGQTFGVCAIASMTSSVNSAGCGEVNRTRSSPSMRPHSVSSSAKAPRLRGNCGSANETPYALTFWPSSVTSSTPVVHQRPHLGQDVVRAAVDLLAPQRRHDAESAAVIAADRDGNPSGVGRFAGGGQRRRKLLQCLGDFDLGNLVVTGPVEQRRQRSDVVGAEHDVDPRRLAQHRVFVFLGQAAAHRDLHVRVAALTRGQMAEVAVELVVGVLAHRAGVEDHHIGVGAVGRAPVARRLQQARQPLRIVDVHLTSVGADLVGAARRQRRALRRRVRCHRRSHGAMVRRIHVRPGRAHASGDRRDRVDYGTARRRLHDRATWRSSAG